uniref:Uncharacterized protein n=1 Tax=Mesocestoides corti TaxID=53468 RepID=A0A5K3G315_MESCO
MSITKAYLHSSERFTQQSDVVKLIKSSTAIVLRSIVAMTSFKMSTRAPSSTLSSSSSSSSSSVAVLPLPSHITVARNLQHTGTPIS